MTPKDKISQTLMQLHANVITWVEAEKVIFPAIDSLVSTAEKQGEETYRAFVENNDTRRAAMATLAKQSQVAHETGKREGLEQGKAEGAEQERNRIRNASEYRGMFGTYVVPAAYLGYPPASVLAPTKEKPERGKPSQALLDELSEICGEKVEYEPKAQP